MTASISFLSDCYDLECSAHSFAESIADEHQKSKHLKLTLASVAETVWWSTASTVVRKEIVFTQESILELMFRAGLNWMR
jgi:hypothetical protein